MSGFGTREFCDCLKRARAKGLSMSQVQVISILSCVPSTIIELQCSTGMTYDGARKSVNRIFMIGDIVPVGVKEGQQIWGLSDQGRRLIEE